MKTLNVIREIMPLLSSIQQNGIFSHPAGILAKNWVEDLANAANEDLIDLSPVLTTIEAIGTATEFEAQQESMCQALKMLDQLLEDIPAGKVPAFTPPLESFRTLRLRLANSIESIIDIYRPERHVLEAMRRDAANMAVAILGEEEIDEAERSAADRAYDMIDRAVRVDFHERRAQLLNAKRELERIAV